MQPAGLMQALHFPVYPFTIHKNGEKFSIFDRIRKKYVALTPEEWVRQHLVWFLIEEKKYPEGRIIVEYSFTVHNRPVRCDLVVFSATGQPVLIAECKALSVSLTNLTLQQVGRYNISTHAPWLVVTNGLKHICCKVDFESEKFIFSEDFPAYHEIAG
jgi:hypothetical protein